MEVLEMNKKENRLQSDTGENDRKDLYGLEPKMSLQSVNFAPSENTLLNEHFEGADKQCD
jgi:hypothetical protein